ncbi:MAG: hypothetical protein AB7P23_08885 [Amphiplicatus sp.]
MRNLAALALALLCGCASTPKTARTAAAAEAGAEEGIVLGALPEAGVPRGACGMVLWTLDENRPTPIFRYVAGKSADLVIDGAPVTMTRLRTNGAAAFGVFESQRFAAPSGIEAEVDVRFSLGFDGGIYLERGLVVVQSPDGWRTVTPSAGLAGCRAK